MPHPVQNQYWWRTNSAVIMLFDSSHLLREYCTRSCTDFLFISPKLNLSTLNHLNTTIIRARIKFCRSLHSMFQFLSCNIAEMCSTTTLWWPNGDNILVPYHQWPLLQTAWGVSTVLLLSVDSASPCVSCTDGRSELTPLCEAGTVQQLHRSKLPSHQMWNECWDTVTACSFPGD